MKLYDLTYLLPQTLAEEEKKATQNRIRTLIEEGGGVLEIQSPLTQKNIAYPIKKQTAALLGNVQFNLEPERIPEFSTKLGKDQNIMRYMLAAKEETAAPKKIRARRMAIRTPSPKLGKPITSKTQPKKTPKVEMEKLEERLEELLKE